MSYLIDVPVEGGGRLLVQAADEDIPEGLVLANRPGEIVGRAGQSLEHALEQLKPAIQAVRGGLAEMAPDEVTVEFGIVLSAETGIVVAKGTTGVHFKVTLNWKQPETGTPAPPPGQATTPRPRAAG